MVIPSKKLILYMGITGIEFIFLKTNLSGKNQIITKGFISSIDELSVKIENRKGTKAYIVLSSKYCYYINLSFPKSAKEKLDNVVKLDLLDKIPYDLPEIYWDYICVDEDHDNIKTLVCFTPRKDIDGTIKAIRRLGFKIAGVTSSFFCTYIYLQGENKPKKGIYILDSSEDEVDGIIIKDDKLLPRPHPLKHRMLQEKESACQWNLSTERDKVLISSISKICLRKLKNKELSLIGKRIRKDIVIPNRFFLYPTPLIAVALLSILIGYKSSAITERAIMSDRQVRKLKKEISRYEDRLRQIKEKEEIKKRIMNFSKQKIKVKDVLIELTKIIPNDSYITYFQMRNGRIRIRGEASSALNLVKLLEESSLFEKCRLVSPVTKNKSNGKERFFIEMNLSSTSSKASSNKNGGIS